MSFFSILHIFKHALSDAAEFYVAVAHCGHARDELTPVHRPVIADRVRSKLHLPICARPSLGQILATQHIAYCLAAKTFRAVHKTRALWQHQLNFSHLLSDCIGDVKSESEAHALNR